MKFIWEATDIKPTDPAGRSLFGCVVENTNTTADNRYSILGYEYHGGRSQLITLTHLDDGLKTASLPLDEMVEYLNIGGYAPVMDARRIRFDR